ncbi:MAG: GSCFA domain-containing protein [Rhodospirillaceae bacterium]|jgi:hypothetical protein|nr:GSCFA domain-containing protein [Rhodospirillaceae bacterium]MBT5565571.1 GSCFA domain-containing protein [Rhodospirillaceae bacterium]MBT6088340.1 GSCFA domain-containing protein [Rhodospirillaceae bacterium]MBT7450356.1 GSCFA domain-containing protein [Rhodospirillaceae bacterium]
MSNAYLTCPYNDLPDRAFFKKLGDRNGDIGVEPDPNLSIGPDDKIISAGSCFAARIATFIRSSGLTYLFSDDRISSDGDDVREESPAIFSLRYGNIYTTRHLVQLLRRVTGKQIINPPVARDENGRYRNLFRPSVLSYKSEDVLRADDDAHLVNIKTMLERATVFTFTLGLTEQWIDNETEITFPSAPGCGFGEFDPSQHTFHNSTQSEVRQELRESIDLLREVNPDLSIILTLSPVPLVATFTSASAVEATFYSKSLLRQAIADVLSEMPESASPLAYFPSYEIVMNPHFISENFAPDMRSISEVGVERVMKQFRRRFVRGAVEEPAISIGLVAQPSVAVADNKLSAGVDPVCEEENIWNAYLAKQEVD